MLQRKYLIPKHNLYIRTFLRDKENLSSNLINLSKKILIFIEVLTQYLLIRYKKNLLWRYQLPILIIHLFVYFVTGSLFRNN